MKIFSTAGVLCFCLFLLSCQKEDDNEEPTKADHISTSAWVYKDGGIDGTKDGVVDLPFPPGTIEACRIDNTLKFEKNGTGTSGEGATKCNANDPQSTSFNWSFADNEGTLVMSNNVYALLNGRFKILELNSTSFRVSKDTVLSGQNLAIIVNLQH
ncbi:MAG TPA: hypothetical protein VGN63_14305 [Flavisolibacter sp.]|jgi:hypothetical protein|nr:hypothetical protein [Flavisolibacter sp.]